MKIGRNEPCPCGSGIKFKKCCLDKGKTGSKDHFPKFKRRFELKGKNAEHALSLLAKETFFEDWCYVNPRLPEWKELCDLLVVFDDTAIIWQVKNLKLREDGQYDPTEVEKNLRQLAGARRQLFDLKTPIKLMSPRRGEEMFDAGIIKRVFMISAFFGETPNFLPFMETIKTYDIHVFTRKFIEIALPELDTISDFVDYLISKEKIDKPQEIIIHGGEEEFLGFYLLNGRSFSRLEKFHLVSIEAGTWDELLGRSEYKAKKVADRISYGWDGMINVAHTCGGDYERVARQMARPNRVVRRALGQSFLDAMVNSKTSPGNSCRRLLDMEGVTYCFLFADRQRPRDGRKKELASICMVARNKRPDNSIVLGIATEKPGEGLCSYDFCLLDIPILSQEQVDLVERISSDLGILRSNDLLSSTVQEYPSIPGDGG
jgi:hypothetical protein